jgi:hypothetical protein
MRLPPYAQAVVTMRSQFWASWAKNFAIQRRGIVTNIILVSAPILFCVLLAILQVIVNILLDGSDFQARNAPPWESGQGGREEGAQRRSRG